MKFNDNFHHITSVGLHKAMMFALCSGAVEVQADGRYSQKTGPIHLDGVRCRAHEPTLAHCWHNEVGVHDCNHDQDVAITCTNDPSELLTRWQLETWDDWMY